LRFESSDISLHTKNNSKHCTDNCKTSIDFTANKYMILLLQFQKKSTNELKTIKLIKKKNEC